MYAHFKCRLWLDTTYKIQSWLTVLPWQDLMQVPEHKPAYHVCVLSYYVCSVWCQGEQESVNQTLIILLARAHYLISLTGLLKAFSK